MLKVFSIWSSSHIFGNSSHFIAANFKFD